ncbi:multicopper like protein [Pseudovirgaria hyperparasitica]|uniref:Multicopper like protein n=1 Tax=Pseudovirgaria hyperparasitica TaxID=470096 RepID=A0A6A6W282_9PEZI|nr:multicopper like protein [Pseudovirgaria hyperparasitica]KAF2757002.1 multicopper like protein [Pseudovirgaria hyperparasitica]
MTSRFLFAGLTALSAIAVASAATVTKEFNIGWVYGNPDGVFNRPVMGINGQWPIPALFVKKGDTLVVNVNNQLGNETTSLHWHGLYQNGTTNMDGPVGVTQCEIPVGGSFTYNFTVDQPGTYWFHSHTRGQYPDGLRAPFIVEDDEMPFADMYDEEIILSFSDWYHDLMPGLLASFISVSNPTGAEPVPDSALMNDTQNLEIPVLPGKTYLLRMVNMAAFAAQYVWIEGHEMQVVEVDGVYTEPATANMLYMTAAQRYSVLFTTKNDTSANFPIMGSMDQDLFDAIPDGLNPNVTGWLVYDGAKDKPAAQELDAFEPFDDFTLVPHDKEPVYENVNHNVQLDLKMDNLGDGANYAFFNDITYVPPKVPTLYTAMTTGETATDPAIYGINTNPFILAQGEVVELVLNNDDPGKHPFHLHGHNFQVLIRSDDDAGFYDAATSNATIPATPMRRDTVLVRPGGHFVLRFRADNPGIWLFHCHIEWHVTSGLIATFVEAPLALQSSNIPHDHLAACAANNPPTPTAGNAAGNTVNLLDLTGNNEPPARLPAGFTPKGIVAMTFSILAALLGVAVIAWYGAQPIASEQGKKMAEHVIGQEGVKSAPAGGEGVGSTAVDSAGGDGGFVRT